MTSGYGYGDQGFGSRSLRRNDEAPPDPLTDSAVRRGVGIGTAVRFHLWGEEDGLDVTLLDIMGVSTWPELAGYVREGWDLEVRAPRCMVIKGPAIRWVELLTT